MRRADGKAFARPGDRVKLWLPVRGGPAFLTGQNFRAVYSYNPSTAYALALCHLADLIAGGPPLQQQFPGGERIPTMAEVKEIQRRLNARGFQDRRHRRAHRQRHRQGGARLREESRHDAGRRLCRAEGAGAVKESN